MREERGQTTVEWLGGTLVLGLLVSILLVPAFGFDDRLSCLVREQIDRVRTIDQEGACGSPAERRRASRAERLIDLRTDARRTGEPRVRRLDVDEPAGAARAAWRDLVDGEPVVREEGGALRVRFREGGAARLRPGSGRGPWRLEVVEHPALDARGTWTFEFA